MDKNNTKLIFLDSLKDLDYGKLKLMCGLEIHQQLNCGKLFSRAPCKIVPNDELNKQVERRLRFSSSESGDFDKAALSEFKKGKYNIYRYNDEIATLVDLDEEPPGDVNRSALNTGVQVGQMMNLKFYDKFQFMRKLIIDGSVTSGFQRTSMLGFGGHLDTSFGKVEIEGINVEEDSCRNIEKTEKCNIYSLDRQGIPLIEITTGPQIKTPQGAQEVAAQIGNILRSFRTTRRGIGTIRQDLNVSVGVGKRVEIKGAQNLKLIPQVVEAEAKRQLILHSISEELKVRKVNVENFSDFKIYNVSGVFDGSDSKVIKSNLEGKNSGVFAIKLNNFKGILGHELHEGFRFASEVSNRNKAHFPQIKGLFHLDEMPNYGITQEDVGNVSNELSLNENDSFILIVNDKNIAEKSLKNVLEIIAELMVGVSEEVRQVDPKGTLTKFLRPMPGAARMYPETDIELIDLSKDDFQKLELDLPELYDQKIERLTKSWNVDDLKVTSFLDKYSEDEITNLLKICQGKASFLYGVIFDLAKDIKKRDKVETYDFKYSLFESLLSEFVKEDMNLKAIRDVFLSLYKDQVEEIDNVKKYLEENNLISEKIDEGELEEKVRQVIENNKGAPFGALMGLTMKAIPGVDGKQVSQILKKLL